MPGISLTGLGSGVPQLRPGLVREARHHCWRVQEEGGTSIIGTSFSMHVHRLTGSRASLEQALGERGPQPSHTLEVSVACHH